MAGLGEEGLNYQTIDNEHFLNSRIFHSLLLFCTLAKDHVNKSLFACFFFSPEYASLGSIFSYCADSNKDLQFEQIVKWATDISRGNQFLSFYYT